MPTWQTDGGRSWQVEGPICSNSLSPADVHTPSDVRVSLDADGDLIGLGTLVFKHPDDDSPDGILKRAGGGRHPMGYTNVKYVLVLPRVELWATCVRVSVVCARRSPVCDALLHPRHVFWRSKDQVREHDPECIAWHATTPCARSAMPLDACVLPAMSLDVCVLPATCRAATGLRP